jgi:YD repeat-containing protein
MGGKETYAYDLEERLCKKTDRNGIESRYTYNLYGNLLLKRAGELSEAYEYTPEGLLRSAVSGGMRYNYAYDAMGCLTGKSASGRKLLSLEYDLNGNLVRQTDVTGKVTEYRYDLMDQLLQVLDDGKAVAEYAYDSDKNLSFLKTCLGNEVFTENHYRYDGNGSIQINYLFKSLNDF